MAITIESIKAKEITIGIFGLGERGLSLLKMFVDAGVNVIAFDFDEDKISSFGHKNNRLKSSSQRDIEGRDLIFLATSDFKQMAYCDAMIVCNSETNPFCAISLKKTYETISTYLKPHSLISLENTLTLSSDKETSNQILEVLKKMQLPQHYFVCLNRTEEIMMSKRIDRKTLSHFVEGVDQKSLELAVALYALVATPASKEETFNLASGFHLPLTLERIRAKEITIGIIGLGYVGLPLSLVFANNDINVIGFDIDETKILSIQNGQSYIHHIDHGNLQKVRKKRKFSATTDFKHIAECDAIIICVPTPLDHHLEPDLRYIVQTSEAIAPHLKPHTLVSLESTTWPGTTEEVVKPILEENGNVKLGDDLYLCFSPEREDPGNKSYNTKNIPKLVGGADQKSLELAVALYSLSIEHVIPLSSTRVAESAKLFENIFRSVNIALVNELKMICDPMGIDVWEVIHAAGTKPFGFMPFWPGPGLGGHCIPIDPFYLTWKAKEYGIRTRFIELAGEINRSMPRYVVGKIQDCLNDYGKPVKGSRLLVLGLAYKADIDDMRESPSLELIKLLEEKGATVDYHDPYIPEIGMNREYKDLIGRKTHPLSSHYDCFVVATKHKTFSPEEVLSYGVPIVDTRNFLPKSNQVIQA